MAEKPNLLDYEPLTVGGKQKARDEETFGPSPFGKESLLVEEGEFHKRRITTVSGELGKKPLNEHELAGKLARNKGLLEWVPRKGHSATFIGLFVFTCLVFFRPYEFSQSLAWLSKSAFWVAVFTIIVFFFNQLGLENRITARPREVNLVLLLLLTAIISIPRAINPLKALVSFGDYIKVVLIFVIMVNVIRTKRRLHILLLLSLTAGCVLSVAAITDYWTGRLALRGVRIQGAIGGLFDNPNDLALHLVTTIPIAIALFLNTRKPLGKLFYLTSSLLMMAGLVATFSRGGFLGLICAVSVAFWRIATKNRWMLSLILPAAVVIFLVASPAGYLTRLSTTNDGSAIARTDDLKRSIVVTLHHPITGVGMNNYTMYSNNNQATHNAYTQVAVELGIAAMVLYVLFIITPLKKLRLIIRETSADRRRSLFYLAMGLEASLIGYMISSFFASVAYLWYVYYLVAYAICLRRLYETESEIKTPGVTSTA